MVEFEGEGEEEDAAMDDDQPVDPGPAVPEYHSLPLLGVPLQHDALVGELTDYDKGNDNGPEMTKQAVLESKNVTALPTSSPLSSLKRCRNPMVPRLCLPTYGNHANLG